ncbi:alpha/beta hydrolase [Flavobacterium sp.]|uniref:alpha/beta hydrolase n=1 Tax=Flavobacterium sp. TaxID=239 RepID=UPI0026398D84|nr:alpha/beta hydrolase [Flavobacterium sp.]
MKTRKIFYFIPIFLFFSFTSCSSDSENSNSTDFATEKTLLNVSYGSNSQQVFDLYLPANRSESSTKTLILIHGGGWVEGDKADFNYIISNLKTSLPNYAIANINYRLSTVGNPAFPMQINDITSVISKLKNSNYGISDDFGFIGASAGAHLSMLYGYGYNTDNNIKMVCSIVGPTNFTDENYLNDPTFNGLLDNVIGFSYEGNETQYQQLSPLFRATSTSPPTLMFYGNADPLIPTTQGIALDNRLTELSVYHEFNLYNGGHGDWSATDQIDSYNKLVAFINNKF